MDTKRSVKIYLGCIISAAAALLPLFASAQTLIYQLITGTTNILYRIIELFFVIATVVFLWGVISFIANSQDETKRNKAKAVMTYGIIGLAVMVAAWGIAFLLVNYFGVGGQGIPTSTTGTIF